MQVQYNIISTRINLSPPLLPFLPKNNTKPPLLTNIPPTPLPITLATTTTTLLTNTTIPPPPNLPNNLPSPPNIIHPLPPLRPTERIESQRSIALTNSLTSSYEQR